MTEILRVEEPGLLTTIQDLGRPSAIASGVPPGGAMDRFAHSAANLLAGNERTAATLECTLTGPRLRALEECVVAITGADLGPRINGEQAAMWAGVSLRAGDELTFGRRRAGARSYIAVAGGIAGDRWLGSMSTYLLVGRGGMHGRPLASGDMIAAVDRPPLEAGRALAAALLPGYGGGILHAIAGPHIERLTHESREALFGSRFTLSPQSNRMGYRLEGPHLRSGGEELLSFGVVAGAVQLPAGGKPILLMADHGTVGGYPVVATVAGASMPVAAQLAPGDELTFVETSIEAALAMRARQRDALDSII